MYHLTLSEDQARIRVLLQQLRETRRDPRRLLRLGDVEQVLANTNDPESFRSLLLVTTHLEEVVESSGDVHYPVWLAMRMPYVITNGPGRKCSASELVSAPVWNTELNWMNVLSHLKRFIPAVRSIATGDRPEHTDQVNAQIRTELTPLLFEMNAVAPVLISEVEALLAIGDAQPLSEPREPETIAASHDIGLVASADSSAVKAKQNATVSATQTEIGDRPSSPPVTATAATSTTKSAPKLRRREKTEKKRRALAVSIADAEADNEHPALQLSLPLFA